MFNCLCINDLFALQRYKNFWTFLLFSLCFKALSSIYLQVGNFSYIQPLNNLHQGQGVVGIFLAWIFSGHREVGIVYLGHEQKSVTLKKSCTYECQELSFYTQKLSFCTIAAILLVCKSISVVSRYKSRRNKKVQNKFLPKIVLHYYALFLKWTQLYICCYCIRKSSFQPFFYFFNSSDKNNE